MVLFGHVWYIMAFTGFTQLCTIFVIIYMLSSYVLKK